jgi:replication initiation and membrane attachment protein
LPSIVYRNQPEFLRKPEGDTSPKAQLIYQFETTSPYDYLIRKNKSTRLSKKDQEILSYLAIDLDLKPGVINVLIDYVLKINNNKLIKNFIFAIAEQWSRSNIKTVEQAMDFAKQEYTKRRVIKKKDNEKEPVWFDQNIKKEEASVDEISELENFMGDL